eukprot:768459-Hanusia_phi.AAC.7
MGQGEGETRGGGGGWKQREEEEEEGRVRVERMKRSGEGGSLLLKIRRRNSDVTSFRKDVERSRKLLHIRSALKDLPAEVEEQRDQLRWKRMQMHSRDEEPNKETESGLQQSENQAKYAHRKVSYHYQTVETLKEIESRLEGELQRLQSENFERHGAFRMIRNLHEGQLVRQMPMRYLEVGDVKEADGQSLLDSHLQIPLDQVQAFYSGQVLKMSKSKLNSHILANKKIWTSVQVGDSTSVSSI